VAIDQSLFVDDPPSTVREADLSVKYPQVVDNYRAAHEIAVRSANGGASTDDLRDALVDYRSPFQSLLTTEQSPVDHCVTWVSPSDYANRRGH
jgi:hypothetical protein